MIRLQAQDREADDEHHHVEQHERKRSTASSSAVRCRRGFRSSAASRAATFAVENPGHVQAQRNRQNERDGEDQNGQSPHGRNLFVLEPFGRSSAANR